MGKNKATKGFNLSVELIMDLMKFKNLRSVNLSVGVEKVLQKAVSAELRGLSNDK